MQPDLFERRGSLALDATFATAKRAVLDAESWVEVVPAWLCGSGELLHRLLTAVPWKQHHRRLFEQTFLEPRLTAEYRDIHAVPHPMVVEMATALSHHYGVVYDSGVAESLSRRPRQHGVASRSFLLPSAMLHRPRPDARRNAPISAETAQRRHVDRAHTAFGRPHRHGRPVSGGLGP